MACSEARLAANRANALKSTGPKTEEGKEAARRNALKHGLTGAGVVIPGEDAAAIARESAGLRRELAPGGDPTADALAERIAMLIVRLRRSARHEFAATAERCRNAALDFDEVRLAEAERLFEAIDEENNRADLLTMPEGLDLLDAALAELRVVAVAAAGDPATWSPEHAARLARCLGGAALDPGAPGQAVARIDRERARLGSIRPTLDHATIASLRAEAVDFVLIDDAPETLRARRYEAACSRELYKALREIRECRKPAPLDSPPIPPPFASVADLLGQVEASRRQYARVEPAAAGAAASAAATSPLGSFFPDTVAVSAAGHKSKPVDAEPAPHGRSRYEDRKKRPKLGR